MNHPALITKSASLITKNKISDRELACDKIISKNSADNFLFYLIELDRPYANSKIITKIIQIVKNRAKTTSGDITNQDFDKLLSALNEGVSRLAEGGERQWMGHLNAIVGLITEKEIILSYSGDIIGYIFRKNKISAITVKDTENSNNPIKTFTDVTSGKLAEDDQFVFSNSPLFQYLPLDKLRQLLKLPSASEAASGLNQILRKAKAANINSIFIESRDPIIAESDSEEIDKFYLDEPEETVLQKITKVLKPAYQESARVLYPIIKKAYVATKHSYDLFSKKWKEQYSKEIAREATKLGNVIGTQANKTKLALEPSLEKLKEHPRYKKVKISAIHYSKSDSGFAFATAIKVIRDGFNTFLLLFKKENRKFLYAILILVVLSISYNKIKENNSNRKETLSKIQVDTSYDRAAKIFADAKIDFNLGKPNTDNQFTEALALATKALDSSKDHDKAMALVKEINLILDENIKAVRFYGVDPATLQENVKNISVTGTTIYGFGEDGKFYAIDMRDKESKLITIFNKEYGVADNLYFSTFENKFVVNTNLNQLYKFDPSTKAFDNMVIVDEGQKWENSTSMGTYSSNIYILDTQLGEVWKHVVREGGYAKGTKYVDTRKISLKNAVDLAVDGNIYVLMNDGSVAKFVKGSLEQDFAVKGIPEPKSKIIEPKKLYTDEDTANIFVLDKGNNRVLKFDKTGSYLNQYYFDGVEIEDFVVNPKLQKLWVLSQGKIYEGNL